MPRPLWFALPLLCLAALAGEPASPAWRAWQLGQQALERDQPEQAIGQFQLSLCLDPKLAQNHLSLRRPTTTTASTCTGALGCTCWACKRARLGGGPGRLGVEELLFGAAAELTLARRHRPDEARACWYLYQV
jgi:hypothetical protein